jgi:AraC-like DNA-binding protein
VKEDSCIAGPSDPVRDRICTDAAVGFVLSGWFEYNSEGRTAVATPGSVVFGNLGAPFFVRHLDTLGNKRLVVFFRQELLDEVAGICGLDGAQFREIALPPGKSAALMFGWMRRLALRTPDRDEAALALAGAALTTSRPLRTPERISAGDEQRIQSAVRYVDDCFAGSCTLGELADVAGLSRFHFLRLFHRATGQSPNQYVVNRRVRAAAEQLIATSAPIAKVAFEVGFNDMSYFYACFKSVFGCTPRQWRHRRH